MISLGRQEQIINEMAQLVSISSNQFSLNTKLYRLEDMIDEAIDLKYVNRILCEESYKVFNR